MARFNMVFPNNTRKALTLSYDDGVEQDIRLIEIMNKYGIKGTFNLNSGLYAPEGHTYAPGTVQRRLTRSAVTALYPASGHEVALHAYTHPNLLTIPREHAAWEVMQDKAMLEAQFGHIIRGLAYPFGLQPGRQADELAETLRRIGIAYARGSVSTGRFDLPQDWLQLNPTCRHIDPRLMTLAKQFIETSVSHAPLLFYLLGHAYEFEADDNWPVIEEFCAYMGGREDIWYATNIEICEYVTAWQQLVSSADGSRVMNPTCRTLKLIKDGQIFAVAPGQEAVLD